MEKGFKFIVGIVVLACILVVSGIFFSLQETTLSPEDEVLQERIDSGEIEISPQGEILVRPEYTGVPNQEDSKLVATLPSMYGEVKVQDVDGVRELSVNDGTMSAINLSNPTQQIWGWDYLYCMEAPFTLPSMPDTPNVYNIGLGGGFLPVRLTQAYSATVQSAEINPAVIQAAQEYFNFTLHVYEGDGRVYLENTDETFDAILIDAAQFHNVSYKVPKNLLTQEFFSVSRSKLSSQGFFVLHFITARPTDRIFEDVHATLESVFPVVQTYRCRNGNVFIGHTTSFNIPEIDTYALNVSTTGRVLTDDFFPYS